MKVKDLIKQLEKFNPESSVVVDGYETGYDLVKEVFATKAFRCDVKIKKAWYDGELHDIVGDEHPTYLRSEGEDAEKIPGEVLDVVYIPRNS